MRQSGAEDPHAEEDSASNDELSWGEKGARLGVKAFGKGSHNVTKLGFSSTGTDWRGFVCFVVRFFGTFTLNSFSPSSHRKSSEKATAKNNLHKRGLVASAKISASPGFL